MVRGAVLSQELILLIHGTGGGRPITFGSQRHWWQLDSAFAMGLAHDLEGSDPGRFRVTDVFRWGDGGANSESVRRTAGVDLERVLRDFDSKGQRYHLVGHSHGGSVIWHALVHSVASGRKPLTNLASWTTVGTPYLEFRPDPFSLWPALPLVAAILATFALWLQYPDLLSNAGAAWQFTEDRAGLIALMVLVLALLAGTVMSCLSLLGFLIAQGRYLVIRGAEKRAARVYAEFFLPLFHPEDEPINGLAATLCEPGEIVPRPRADGRPVGWRRILAGFGGLGSHLVARPVDQFVWKVLARGVQGDDLAHERLVRVGPLPAAMPRLPMVFEAPELSEYIVSANAGAAVIAQNARALLARFASGELPYVSPHSLSGVIDWAGIIHTSYFELDPVRIRVADWIRRRQRDTAGEPIPEARFFPYAPKALIRTYVFASLVAVGVLASFASLLSTTTIYPYSRQSMAERLDAQFSDPLLASVENSDLPGQLMVQLQSLPRVAQREVVAAPGRTLGQLPDPNSRFRSAALYVGWLARNAFGDFDPVLSFLNEYVQANSSELLHEQAFLGLHALHAVAGDPAYAAYASVHRQVLEIFTSTAETYEPFLNRPFYLAMVIDVGRRLHAENLIRPYLERFSATYGCDLARPMAIALVRQGIPDVAGRLMNACTATEMAAAVVQMVTFLRDVDPDVALIALLTEIANEPSAGPDVIAQKPDLEAFLLELAGHQQSGNMVAAASAAREFSLHFDNDANFGRVVPLAKSWEALANSFPDEYANERRMLLSILGAEYTVYLFVNGPLVRTEVTRAVIDNYVEVDNESTIYNLAQSWEAMGDDPLWERSSAAAYTHAGIAYRAAAAAGLATEDKPATLFAAALEALPRQRDDAAGYAVTIAEEVYEMGELNLLSAAIATASEYALRAQNFEVRATYLGRIAVLKAALGDFPDALRLIDAAGVPASRFRSLMNISETVLQDTPSATRKPRYKELIELPTAWIDQPTDLSGRLELP